MMDVWQTWTVIYIFYLCIFKIIQIIVDIKETENMYEFLSI